MLGIIGSFSPRFYPKITRQKAGKSIALLFVLILIISVLLALKYTAVVKREMPKASFWLQENFAEIISDLPEIEIADGKLISPRRPYTKEWGDNLVFIIEPREERLYSTLQKYPDAIALSESKLVFKSTDQEQGQSEIKTNDLDGIKSLKLSPADEGLKINIMDQSFNATPAAIATFFEKLSLIVFPLFLIWLIFIYAIIKTIQIFCFSLISLLFNNNLKKRLNYQHLINIGIYALVPCSALGLLKDLSGVEIPLFGAIYFTVYVVYLALGIKANEEIPPAAPAAVDEGEIWKESA